MSAESGPDSCMLSIFDVSAVSGANSTCTLLDLRVDISQRVRRRSSSAAGKRDIKQDECRQLGGGTLSLSVCAHGYAHQRTRRSKGGACRGWCMTSFYGVCVPR